MLTAATLRGSVIPIMLPNLGGMLVYVEGVWRGGCVCVGGGGEECMCWNSKEKEFWYQLLS